ncbi:MAG: gamma-glutamylcyclotransferase [Holophagaceae bacterium]|nr:gamma-glutamylcyclotransferase [Holophagaceae bacterium]
MEADGLFVYGTLREGGTGHAWLKRTNPIGTTTAYAPGRLFHLPGTGLAAMVPGSIPEALPPGAGWVVGEFIGYEDEEDLDSALDNLDQLEGLAEGRFERKMVPVLLVSGQTYAAWAYVFPVERSLRLEREGVELLDGDWSGYLG